MRNKELIANVPSISCVENYFLGWCMEQGIGAEILYNRTYLPAGEILADFIYSDTRFENYDKIERIMAVAEGYGVTGHLMAVGLNLENIDSAIRGGRLALVEVNEHFFENIARKPWRDDHYIWLTEKTDKGYLYLNNYPLSAGEISVKELTGIYNGRTLVYDKKDGIAPVFVRDDAERQIWKIIYTDHMDFTLPEDVDLTALRDAMGILKITRRRLADWFKAAGTMGRLTKREQTNSLIRFLRDYCAELNGFYVRLEAAILRKKSDLDKAREAVSNIIDRERELSRLVKESVV